MSETKETDHKTAGGRKTMSLNVKRTVEQGHIRQNFSHGRSKSVLVETKRKRPVSPSSAHEEPQPQKPAPQKPEPRAFQKPAPDHAGDKRPQKVLRQLSAGEVDARARALLEARKREDVEKREREIEEARLREEAQKRAIEDQKRRVEEEAARKVEEEAERQRAAEAAKVNEAAKAKEEEAAPRVPERPAEPPRRAGPDVRIMARPRPDDRRPVPPRQGENGPSPRGPARDGAREGTRPPAREGARADGPRPAGGARPGPGGRPAAGGARPAPAPVLDVGGRPERVREGEVALRVRPADADEEDRRVKRGGLPGKAPERAAPVKKTAVDQRLGRQRLTLSNALDEQQRERSLASLKRQRERQKLQALGGARQERVKIQRMVQLPEAITIQELANRMAERAVDIIKFLMKQGQMLKINDVIDADTAELVAAEFGHTVKRVSEEDVEEGFIGEVDADETLKPRAPVVTIMGHVDHGKTSLLDAIRQANVVAGEAGGITQHIGAYQVTTPNGDPITFIDTPGHAAFTAMRARGAKVTDIVVLVVAADDGVMPQTIEAINHAKSAGVPIIVAINKIDKPDADPLRVRTDLLSHDIVVESMGGDTLEVEVSAKQRLNLDKLLSAINLQAEVLELTANPDRPAEGIVIEAKLERGRGPVGTVLVQRGTLKVGQLIVAGRAWGRVRALIDDKGENVVTAGPSTPVEVLGFDSAPEAGDQLAVVDNEARARELTEHRVRKLRDVRAVGAGARTLEQMMKQAAKGGKKEFLLIIKGDVQGSVEAINSALDKLGTDEVEARIIHWAVGGITSSDVALAEASGAVIIAFNVRADAQAKQQAERDGVEIRYYAIIYDLVDDVKKAMSGLLAPITREEFLGNAEILEVFNISKVGKVAGCRVTDGKVERGANVRLIRDNVVIHEGKLSTLKRFKDEVREVVAGQECGMGFENYHDMKQGDVIECFRTHIETRSL